MDDLMTGKTVDNREWGQAALPHTTLSVWTRCVEPGCWLVVLSAGDGWEPYAVQERGTGIGGWHWGLRALSLADREATRAAAQQVADEWATTKWAHRAWAAE